MNLKQKLDYHYRAFDKAQISPDPLQFLHLFNDEKDIEVIGFIASIFAYGNVNQIINTLTKILSVADQKPFEFIYNFMKKKNYARKLDGLYHRFYTTEDINTLFYMMSEVYNDLGSIRQLFLNQYEFDSNIKNSLSHISDYFTKFAREINRKNLTAGIKFMFPFPEKGSACKRMNLFLRWMVRKDELDFGIWKEISPANLIIPVDTHVARICGSLGLTKRKNIGWKMAEEITENLKKFDGDDPVKYDFAICHIGMRKMKF